MRFRRFLSVLLCVVIISAMSLPVYAAESTESEVKEMTWGDTVVKYAFTPLYDMITGVVVGAAEAIDTMTDETRENFQANVIDNLEFWKDIVDTLTYEDYVSSLDSTTAKSGILATGFSASSFGKSSVSGTTGGYRALAAAYPDETFLLTKSLGVNDKVLIAAVTNNYLYGVYFDESGLLSGGLFRNPTGELSSSYFGVYDLSSLTYIEWKHSPTYYDTYYSKNHSDAASNDFSLEGYAFNWDSTYYMYGSDLISDFYRRRQSSSEWDSYTSVNNSLVNWSENSDSNNYYYPNTDSVSFSSTTVVVQPTGTDFATRAGSLMQTINNYNGDYSYTDNSTAVNYYIGVPNDDGTVDDLYSMAFYDEETLVFTEPTSGYQILSTGWTYDYPTRTYDIAVASGTCTADLGVDITRITAAYGNEAVTMTAYLADGTEYMNEEFSYVAVSQSESALCSHSYTYETISEPTCITPGERKYTCSICGNEYSEDVAALGHDWVLIEETDTEQTYECSVCGIQYTSTDGTSPPSDYDDGSGGSGSGSSDDESVWDKLGRLIGTLLDGIVDLFDAVLGKLLDSLINLADTISTKCTQIVDRLLTMLDDIPRLFGAFPDFLGAVFPFIPEDIMLIIEFGIAAAVFVGVLLLILKR